MRFWVGITDPDWYGHLAPLDPVEVNFWQPSGRAPASQILQPGVPFLFKLRGASFVVGGGFFVQFSVLPASIVWSAFGELNGAPTEAALLERLSRLRRESRVPPMAPIGCCVLNEPVFLSEDEWISAPRDWAPQTQVGKSYDSDEEVGHALWEAFAKRLPARGVLAAGAIAERLRYGADYVARTRLGQGAFQVLVTNAYHRCCAVTTERTLPALEVAHIRAYGEEGPHRVENGVLLRADIHRLFDAGYVTFDYARGQRDLRFLVSDRIREHFENGRDYYRLHGASLTNLPDATGDWPSRDFLDWHHEHRFLDLQE